MKVISSETETLADKRSALLSLLKEADKKVRPIIYESLLINGYEQNLYDMDIFISYCDAPCTSLGIFKTKVCCKVGNNNECNNFVQYKSNMAKTPQLEEVALAHLQQFLQTTKNLKTFSSYIEHDRLKLILAENQAMAGGSLQDYKEILGSEAAEKLEALKILDFAVHSKREFDAREPVHVYLKIKNIQKLVCKVFEVDTLHYYQTHGKELDETIDLDGLKPEDTIEFRYAFPKQQLHIQKIHLEEVTKKPQGLFVAEFIGGAISCRMIIRKGTLQLISAEHHQGITFNIIDEKMQICAGESTGILMDDKFYECGEDGKILFPFQAGVLDNKQVIAVHQGFSSLTNLSIPQETYYLKTAAIFNEEGLVRDQVNTLILRMKLYLNDTPITMKKIESCTVVIESKDFEQINNVREFKDQVPKDDEDLVLSLPTLKLASLIKIKITVKVKNLRGNEKTLTENHTITVDRNFNQDKYCTVHLRTQPTKAGKEYSVHLLGKNGEPISNHKIHIQLLKSFGDYDFEKVLFTDLKGKINLRTVDDMKYILVKYGHQLNCRRLFVIPSDYEGIDIPHLLELCEGEKLLLPSLGKKVSRDEVELVKVGQNPYNKSERLLLNDCFDLLKTEMNSIVASNISEGEYYFRYNLYPCKEVKIIVHKGTRWGNSPYMLAKRRSIIELKPESRYLSLNYMQRSGDKLHLHLSSNSFKTVRAHVLGYNFAPYLSSLLNQRLESTNPQFVSVKTPLRFVSSSFLSNRELSDELRYVQQRSTLQTMIGNTLDKPSLLLHREKVKETKDDEEVIHQGKGFEKDKRMQVVKEEKKEDFKREFHEMVDISRNRGDMIRGCGNPDDMDHKSHNLESYAFAKKKEPGFPGSGAIGMLKDMFSGKEKKFEGIDWSSRQRFEVREEKGMTEFIINNNMDYALSTGTVLSNIKPSDEGTIIVDLNTLAGCNVLQIFLIDSNSSTVKHLNLAGSTDLNTKDLRVSQSLTPGSIWIRDYKVSASVARDGNQIVDHSNLSGLEAVLIKNGRDLMDNLCTLSSAKFDISALMELRFLADWPSLPFEEKFSHWEKYGGTELMIFTYFRDNAFWQKYIMPMIICKAKFSTEDILLLAIETREERFMTLVPAWEALSKLSPLILTLACILNNDYIDSAIELLSGTSPHTTTDDLRLAIETLISQNSSKTPESAQVTPDKPESSKARLGVHGMKVMPTNKETNVRGGDVPDVENVQMMLCNENEQSMDGRIGLSEVNEPIDGLICIDDKKIQGYLEEYKTAPVAWELKERQEYFKGQMDDLSNKRFWLELLSGLKRCSSGSLDFSGFVATEDLLFMTETATEVLLALTFTKIPLGQNEIITQEQTSEAVRVISTDCFILLTKSVKSVQGGSRQDSELVLSQKFYDPQDKFLYDQDDSSIYYIKEVKEFMTAKIYESRISVTNLSESVLNLQLISQIPQGALPVYSLEDLKIISKKFAPMSTEFFTFRFYFPNVGTFEWYPATLTRCNELAAFTKQIDPRLSVVTEYSEENKPMATIKDIAAHGTSNDLLNFLSNANVFNTEQVDLNSIVWVCKESQSAYLRLIEILKKKGVFVQSIWRYSIYYGHESTFKELVESTTDKFLQKYQYLKLPYGIEKKSFEIMEYDPLVNPRAHSLSTGKDEKGFSSIRNTAFRETYARFLAYCAEKIHLSVDDLVAMNGYWIAMDRVRDALDLNRKIKRDFCQDGDQPVSIQFDYICAYLSIYEEMPEFKTARKLVSIYRKYPDLSWRERFLAIEHQLQEFDQGQLPEKKQKEDYIVKIQDNREQAEKTEYLQVEKIRSEKDHTKWAIQLTHKNVSGITIKFFKIDIELLFSKDPFMENKNGGICSVAPNHELKFRVTKADFFKKAVIEVPSSLSTENLIVQVSSKDKQESVELYNSDLRVHLLDNYGLVRVLDNRDRDLHTCYVKCYAKSAGVVSFHKDGYTDFRGIFDYCSTNSSADRLANIETFSLLVSHPDYGSTLTSAKPPKPAAVLRQSKTDQSIADYRDAYDRHHRLPDQFSELK